MKKTAKGARRRKLKSLFIFRKSCKHGLSADDLSVFSSALRPCLHCLFTDNRRTSRVRFLSSNFIKGIVLTITFAIGIFATLNPDSTYATNASITLTVPKTLSVQVEPGKGMKTGTGKVSIQSDAEYGYTLGINAKTSGTELKSAENNTISSITANTNSIPTSSWGWRYGEWSGTNGDPNNTSFLASPTTSVTNIANLNASTGGVNKNYYLTVGANVSADQATGTYTKDFVLTATAKPKTFKITYNVNGGTSIAQGSGSTYTKKATFTTALASTKTNYIFMGWCSVPTTSASCSGTTYAASTLYTIDAPTGDNMQLYAIWRYDRLPITTMQEYGKMTVAEKTNFRNLMEKNTQYELQDSRDGRTYYVSKLADDNIWMTENLDLNLSASKTLTPSDTDIPAIWKPDNSTYAKSDATTWTINNYKPYSYDPGDRCWTGEHAPQSSENINNDSLAKNCDKHDSSHYHVGNYYNWTAAVAMNDTSTYTTTGQDLNQSICPKGWRLPTTLGTKSLKNLKDISGFTYGDFYKSPYFIPESGLYRGYSLWFGHNGAFWTNVVSDSNKYANMNYFSQGMIILPHTGYERYLGFAVRCVARTEDDSPTPYSINAIATMQQYGRLTDSQKTQVKDSMIQNFQYSLKDERDNRIYYIAKLADNNIWMTENLDLDLSVTKTLTPNDTDIPANWTPPRSTLTQAQLSSWIDSNSAPYSYDPGDRCWNGTLADSDGGTTINDDAAATDCSKHDSSHRHVGNYYNWSAAVAMDDTSTLVTHGQDADRSICPKGWRLPVGTGDKSFKNLEDKIGGTLKAGASGTIHNSPYYFTYSGGANGRRTYFVGYVGFYWTSTATGSEGKTSSVLYFSSSGQLVSYHSGGYQRYDGFPVRCVAR